MRSISLLVEDSNLVKELDDKAAEVFNGGGVECQYNNGEIQQCIEIEGNKRTTCQYNNGEIQQCTEIEGNKRTTCQYNNGEIQNCVENNLNLPIDLGKLIDSSNVVTATIKS